MNQLEELTEKVKAVIEHYRQDYPEIEMNKDYIPLKITEEWGECLQAYLKLTKQGRLKGKTKEEVRENFSEELADVFGYLLVFADQEGIDPVRALENKWFKHFKEK